MADAKSVLGIVIVVLGAVVLISMLIANVLKLSLPRFVKDNSIEITLLMLVSCIMGIILIIF